jgi:hypothetical protein
VAAFEAGEAGSSAYVGAAPGTTTWSIAFALVPAAGAGEL